MECHVVDLEWNRKTIFEKLDWLKNTLEDVIAKANQNITVHQEQLRAVFNRLAVLEKHAPKPTSAKISAKLQKPASAKKSTSMKRRTVHRPTKRR
jgi:hypothetical protein